MAAAPVLSGLEGSTHVLEFYKSCKITVLNLFCLILKVIIWPLNNLQHGIMKQSCKSKCKYEQSNAGMYLITCGVLVLMPVLLTHNPPKTVATKAHRINVDPLGILLGKNTTTSFWIWLCRSLYTD